MPASSASPKPSSASRRSTSPITPRSGACSPTPAPVSAVPSWSIAIRCRRAATRPSAPISSSATATAPVARRRSSRPRDHPQGPRLPRRHQQALCRRLHRRALWPAARRSARAPDRDQSQPLHGRGSAWKKTPASPAPPNLLRAFVERLIGIAGNLLRHRFAARRRMTGAAQSAGGKLAPPQLTEILHQLSRPRPTARRCRASASASASTTRLRRIRSGHGGRPRRRDRHPPMACRPFSRSRHRRRRGRQLESRRRICLAHRPCRRHARLHLRPADLGHTHRPGAQWRRHCRRNGAAVYRRALPCCRRWRLAFPRRKKPAPQVPRDRAIVVGPDDDDFALSLFRPGYSALSRTREALPHDPLRLRLLRLCDARLRPYRSRRRKRSEIL